MKELPIACTLSATERRRRREALLPGLLASAVERLSIPNGYRWRFEAGEDLLADIASVIDAERRCCRFLHFVVTAEPDTGPISLEVTGPPGTRGFLDRLTADSG